MVIMKILHEKDTMVYEIVVCLRVEGPIMKLNKIIGVSVCRGAMMKLK